MSIPFCFNFYYCGCVLRALYTDSTHNTQHTPIIHRSTYPNPSPHPHTQTQTQPSNKVTHKHNPATKPSHTHKHKPIQKSGHRSKTQARPPIHTADQPIHVADLKLRPPIKNRSKSIQKKSSPEPPQPQPNHDHDPTTTNDPLQPPIHDQRPIHPSSPIHDHDPTTPIHNHADPQPTTTTDPRRHPRPKHRTHNPTTTNDPNNGPNHDPQPLLSSNHSQKPQPSQPKTTTREGRERRDGVWVCREERAEIEKQRREGRERKELRKETVGIKYIYIF